MPQFVNLTTANNEKLAINLDHIMAVIDVIRQDTHLANYKVSRTVVVLTGQLCYDVKGTVEEVVKNISLASGE